MSLTVNLKTVFSILFPQESTSETETKKKDTVEALLDLKDFCISMTPLEFIKTLKQEGVDPESILLLLEILFGVQETRSENLDHEEMSSEPAQKITKPHTERPSLKNSKNSDTIEKNQGCGDQIPHGKECSVIPDFGQAEKQQEKEDPLNGTIVSSRVDIEISPEFYKSVSENDERMKKIFGDEGNNDPSLEAIFSYVHGLYQEQNEIDDGATYFKLTYVFSRLNPLLIFDHIGLAEMLIGFKKYPITQNAITQYASKDQLKKILDGSDPNILHACYYSEHPNYDLVLQIVRKVLLKLDTADLERILVYSIPCNHHEVVQYARNTLSDFFISVVQNFIKDKDHFFTDTKLDFNMRRFLFECTDEEYFLNFRTIFQENYEKYDTRVQEEILKIIQLREKGTSKQTVPTLDESRENRGSVIKDLEEEKTQEKNNAVTDDSDFTFGKFCGHIKTIVIGFPSEETSCVPYALCPTASGYILYLKDESLLYDILEEEFRSASCSSHETHVLKLIEAMSLEQRNSVVSKNNGFFLRTASSIGYHKTCLVLINSASRETIISDNYHLIFRASSLWHHNPLEWTKAIESMFEKLTPSEVSQVIRIDQFYFLKKSCLDGYILLSRMFYRYMTKGDVELFKMIHPDATHPVIENTLNFIKDQEDVDMRVRVVNELWIKDFSGKDASVEPSVVFHQPLKYCKSIAAGTYTTDACVCFDTLQEMEHAFFAVSPDDTCEMIRIMTKSQFKHILKKIANERGYHTIMDLIVGQKDAPRDVVLYIVRLLPLSTFVMGVCSELKTFVKSKGNDHELLNIIFSKMTPKILKEVLDMTKFFCIRYVALLRGSLDSMTLIYQKMVEAGHICEFKALQENDLEGYPEALNFIKTQEIDSTDEVYQSLLDMIKQNEKVLDHVPLKYRNKEMCLEAIRSRASNFVDVPVIFQNKEVCIKAVKSNAYSLQYVPKELIDREMCLGAVKQVGWSLKYVPEELIDRELCLEAMKQDGHSLLHVPEKLRIREVCLEAVKSIGYSLKDVPKNLRDREICLEAVKNVGYILCYVPEEIIDKEICLEAVKRDGRSLCWVPKKLIDREMCLKAVKQDGSSLYHVPEELRNKEMCLEAVKQDGSSLKYVPEELRDKEMCLEAVKQDGSSLKYVPEELRDKEMCLEAKK